MSAVSTRTQKLIAAGAIIALALLSVQAFTLVATQNLSDVGIHAASGATDPSTNSTITVTGTGQVTIQPTMALVTIGVDTQASSAQTAAQNNANTMTEVISALENLGINSSDIQTVSYNIYQQSGPVAQPVICSTPNNVTSGCFPTGTYYEVDNEVQVTISVASSSVSQLGTQAGAAIDAAVAAGANEVYGVQFSASQSAMQQANQQAEQLAVQDASGQANAVASALNVTITGVVSVTTTPGYTGVVYAYPASNAVQTPIQSQTLTISASVQVVYAIS